MKKFIALTAIVLLPNILVLGGTITLSGKYKGENVYVVNPITYIHSGFCTTELSINVKLVTGTFQSSAYEIDLTKFNLKAEDDVILKIKHQDDCKPRILNPEAFEKNL